FSQETAMKNYLRERFAFLAIAIGNWLFAEYQHPKRCDRFKNIWMRARFGGMSMNINLGEDLELMWTIPGTTPDTNFTLGPLTNATFSEGGPVRVFDPPLYAIQTPVSDNEGAVSFPSYSPPPDASTAGNGVAHWGTPNTDGSPNIANLRADVTRISDGQ